MAITRAQQAKQMLQDGGMLVKPSTDGKRPGYRSAKVQAAREKSYAPTMSPGRSMAQFGHAGHAGKSVNTAKRHQREGRDVPDNAPSSAQNPYAGHSPKEIPAADTNKDGKVGFIEKFNAKRRKKNREYIQNLRNKKFKGIMDAYNLTEAQLNNLLTGGGQLGENFAGGRGLTFTGLQQILDMDPSARNLGQSFNEDLMQGKLGALEMSPRMKKTGQNLSIAELFSTEDPTTRIDLPGVLGLVQGDENFSNLLSGLNRLETLDVLANQPGGVKQSDIDNYRSLTMGKGGVDPVTGNIVDPLFYEQPGDDRSNESDPCLGPNPPAYCPPRDSEDPEDETPKRNLAGLTPRIGGGIFDFTEFAADGGRIGLRGGKDASKDDYKTPSTTASAPPSLGFGNPPPSTSGGGDDGDGPKGPPIVINPPPKEKSPFKKKSPTGVENAFRTVGELNYLRNLFRMDPVGLGLSFVGNKISDFLFPPAGASELSEDELNILKATGQLENQKQKILDATGIGSGAEVGPVPDLTDPKVAGGIAEAGGLTTGLKKVGDRANLVLFLREHSDSPVPLP